MAKQSFSRRYRALITIGIIAFLGACAIVAAASGAGFGASVLEPMPNPSGRGVSIGLFRTHWCGNGKVEVREQCDDGNRTTGDGCSNRCRFETNMRYCADGHKIGDRFPSPDGCNTCVCTTSGIACTLRACAQKSSSANLSSRPASMNTKCLSSNQCPHGQYCTTEDGDCQSACEPGAQVCIQACAGVCRSTTCKPTICPDGTRHPSCTTEGHVINYFADPCLTRQSSSSVRTTCGDGICQEGEATRNAVTGCPKDCAHTPICGDNICESGEGNWCPACTYASPPCMAPCRAGTCPQDCGR